MTASVFYVLLELAFAIGLPGLLAEVEAPALYLATYILGVTAGTIAGVAMTYSFMGGKR